MVSTRAVETRAPGILRARATVVRVNPKTLGNTTLALGNTTLMLGNTTLMTVTLGNTTLTLGKMTLTKTLDTPETVILVTMTEEILIDLAPPETNTVVTIGTTVETNTVVTIGTIPQDTIIDPPKKTLTTRIEITPKTPPGKKTDDPRRGNLENQT
jgi:hypothetical protein